MVKIRIATTADTEVLALLGRVTWEESHGHYIDDKNNLLEYLNNNFSVPKTKKEINNPKNLFYIMHVDDVPAGYAKIILKENQESVASQNSCRLERIFIQNEFIALKVGQQLLTFVEERANALQFDTMWLSVYIKNKRAIRFYEKNEFKNVGDLNFIVNGKAYDNIVFSKNI